MRFDKNSFACWCEKEDEKASGSEIWHFYWPFSSDIMAVKGLKEEAASTVLMLILTLSASASLSLRLATCCWRPCSCSEVCRSSADWELWASSSLSSSAWECRSWSWYSCSRDLHSAPQKKTAVQKGLSFLVKLAQSRPSFLVKLAQSRPSFLEKLQYSVCVCVCAHTYESIIMRTHMFIILPLPTSRAIHKTYHKPLTFAEETMHNSDT